MRVFTKNSANYMTLGVNALGPSLSGVGKISLSVKVKITSVDDGSDLNSVFVILLNGSTIGAIVNIDGTGGVPKVRIGGRSVNTDSRQVKTGGTALSFGVDTFIGGVIDIPGDAITVYTAGASDGVGAVTFANATWTLGTPTGADTVGGYLASPATTSQTDGEISEIALWAGSAGLSAGNFTSLAAGVAADAVSTTDTLVYYLKIAGVDSPETPTVGSANGTITGSLPGPVVSRGGLMMMGFG